MKKNMNVTGAERKALAKAIGAFLNEYPKYLGMPSCSYQIGGFILDKNGTLEYEDCPQAGALLAALVDQGYTFDDVAETPAPETTTEEPCRLVVSLPMASHTGASLRNLVSMIFSRGKLLSKATGGCFSCNEELVDTLRDEACVLNTERFLKTLTDFESQHDTALEGLSFTEDRISFTGFPYTEDPERIKAFDQLACQMCKLAREQKRTLAREVDGSNERYIFRIWLIRLGMAGEEFKTARKILLAPLSGSAAFKDSAMEGRWREKQVAKRDAMRAAKQAAQENSEEGSSDENAE